MATVRSASGDDLDLIVTITRTQRRQLARWSPIYFNPRQGADEAHARFLSFLVGSGDHQTFVVEDRFGPFGFYVRIQQQNHVWVDDLCITDSARWSEALSVVAATVTTSWVTCASVRDQERLEALRKAGLRTISTYHARQTSATDSQSERGLSRVDVRADPSRGAPHTFGGRTFDATTPGALIVATGDGYAIGSPSVSPPIYDPGGTTCVVDQVVGGDRMALIEHAVAAASARGDAQVIVVSAEHDHELKDTLSRAGFNEEVVLVGS